MKPHLFTLLLRSADIDRRIEDLQSRTSPNPLELLSLKTERAVVRQRIRKAQTAEFFWFRKSQMAAN